MAAKGRGADRGGSSGLWVWVVAAGVGIVACIGIVGFLIPALTAEEPVGPDEAADLYIRNCGTCHGDEGQGNIGPQLAGGTVVERYPDIDDQIAVIADGRNAMPPFGQALSDAEIRAIAEHTRRL